MRSLLIFAAIIVVVIGVISYLSLRSREHAPVTPTSQSVPRTTSGPQQNEAPASPSTASNASSTTPSGSHTRTFAVTGSNFSFDVSELRVNVGDTVTIKFTSQNGTHDWVLDEFGARTARVGSGETTSVTFTPDRAGTFEYYCSVGSHRAMGMVGKLIVE